MPNTSIIIGGQVKPGFEAIRRKFEQDLYQLAEENLQLCIYLKDEKVVDLWGSACGDESFTADTLVNVFSSGKSLEAIALAWLVSQGLLDYDNTIASYWPEFGGADKQSLTVADLMRHEAGLSALNQRIPPEDLLSHNIKQNKVGRVIEAHPQHFRGESPREYHAITRGWIANELFRRVDPTGRTIGEFLREEISQPLDVDVFIGLSSDELSRTCPFKLLRLGYHFRQTLIPRVLGRTVNDNIFQLAGKFLPLVRQYRRRSRETLPVPLEGMDGIEFFNDPSIARGETPSANTHASARGLAKVAAMMASGGRFENTVCLSEKAWRAMHSEPITRSMGISTTFTQGGVAHFHEQKHYRLALDKAISKGREGFYGWMGLGGSVFQWHPELKIGFGYIPTSLHVLDIVNERGKQYQRIFMQCLQRSEGSV